MAAIDLSFITSLKDRVKETFDEADEAGRRQLLDALRDLQYSVEPPEETMQRIIHQVRSRVKGLVESTSHGSTQQY